MKKNKMVKKAIAIQSIFNNGWYFCIMVWAYNKKTAERKEAQ